MLTIDFHVHIDERRTLEMNGVPMNLGRDDVMVAMDEAGIDISVLLVMAKKGQLSLTQKQNTWLARLCTEDPRLFGFGSVHPGDGQAALEEMSRCVHELGLKGFKLHPNTQEFDCGESVLIDVLKHAAHLHVPVLIDSYAPGDDTQPSKLFKAVLASPETTVCFAHDGFQYLWIP